MRLIDSASVDPSDNIALDTLLLLALEENRTGETLRFWESGRAAVIVGSLGAVGRQVREEACLADDVPVIRRPSGGGAVVVARGCLNYSLVLSLEARPDLRDVRHSFGVILGRIVEALEIPGLVVCGDGDLAIDQRKVSGSAQRRGRRALLHHGTFLYAFDVRSIERYLKEPERQPAYRGGRRHASFVTNAPLGPDAIKSAVRRAWDATAETNGATGSPPWSQHRSGNGDARSRCSA
jgi:lipoate-protein ligase A